MRRLFTVIKFVLIVDFLWDRMLSYSSSASTQAPPFSHAAIAAFKQYKLGISPSSRIDCSTPIARCHCPAASRELTAEEYACTDGLISSSLIRRSSDKLHSHHWNSSGFDASEVFLLCRLSRCSAWLHAIIANRYVVSFGLMLYFVCISFNICTATSGLKSRLHALITELIAIMLTKPRCLLSKLAAARRYFKSIPYKSIKLSASFH
mmetsp:Transcript_17385/g.29445  ORF Transcript_17385/g.29445 Transcript_17385/m.29445 type:complete len:207 (-) Transcript_17385:2413-3033(-)